MPKSAPGCGIVGRVSEPEIPARTVRQRRQRAEGGRPHTVRVSLSEAEYAAIHAAAIRAGQADGSWLGDLGSRSATQPHEAAPPQEWGEALQALMSTSGELAEDRRVLRNVGGNLNDVARHANTGPELHEATAQVVAMVERAVARIDATLDELDEPERAAYAARLRGLA